MKRIQIRGLPEQVRFGGFETQLGNAAIIIPCVKLLKKYIPDVEISTTFQLSEKFCANHGINCIPQSRRILANSSNFQIIGSIFFGVKLFLTAIFNYFRAFLWQLINSIFNIDLCFLLNSKDLKSSSKADIILDLNGDIFPSDSHPVRIITHIFNILAIRQLGTPVVEFISSPGPFDNWFRKFISKIFYDRINVILNREPISSELLNKIGIKEVPIINTACSAFKLEPVPIERSKEILLQEGIDIEARPLIGVTLAGYNLISQRTWGRPKNFDDLAIFVPMIKYLLDNLKARVILLPHVYRRNPYTYDGEFINGPDYDILLHLYRMVNGDDYSRRIRLIEGKYTPSEAKGIIGQCDMYISGRLHAGVAALSQYVPTVLVAYGHKHLGFARLLNQEKNVYVGKDPDRLKEKVEYVWNNREEIKTVLKDRMVRVRELVNLNFEIVKEILDLDEKDRNRISSEVSDAWVKKVDNINRTEGSIYQRSIK